MPSEQPSAPPPVPLALVEWLAYVWPDRFPDLTESAVELHRHAGRLDVIRFLRQHAERQAAQAQAGRPTPRSPF